MMYIYYKKKTENENQNIAADPINTHTQTTITQKNNVT